MRRDRLVARVESVLQRNPRRSAAVIERQYDTWMHHLHYSHEHDLGRFFFDAYPEGERLYRKTGIGKRPLSMNMSGRRNVYRMEMERLVVMREAVIKDARKAARQEAAAFIESYC